MFKFFKDKIKKAVSNFSEKVEELPEEEIQVTTDDSIQDSKEEIQETPTPKTKKEPEEKKEKKEHVKEKEKRSQIPKAQEPIKEVTPKEAPKEKEETKEIIKEEEHEKEEIVEEPKKEVEKKGFFNKILTKKIDASKFEEFFFELEITLLENNVSLEVIEKIKEDMKVALLNQPVARNKVEQTIKDTLKKSVDEILSMTPLKFDFSKKPLVICLLGINGSGKTTSTAKLTKYFQDQGKTIVLAAADTFRAAAIEQLQEHADNLGVKLIRQEYKSDPAAVAFDAIKHAEAKGIDVVLIDTAGRIHSNVNLMNEMKKVIKVANPDLKLFVGESITGNDCIEQARKFNESVGIDGIILSKADIDEKGGTAISISYITKCPIVFLGVGQNYEDLMPFDKEKILNQLFS